MLRMKPAAAALLCAAALGACQRAGPSQIAGADPARGKVLIGRIGCGSCHLIPGVDGANGLVGPSLAHMSRRTIIAGFLPNTSDNMVRWLRTPQSVLPGNAMPNMEIDDHDARDVAAYLYTLR